MKDLVLNGIGKAFDGRKVLENVSLRFPAGSVTCILGPSGCGKTTLLRIAAGLEQPDAGTVDGRPDQISFVFQEDRLCEEFSAVTNVRLAAGKNLTKEEIARHLTEIGLGNDLDKPVRDFSGGMKRRVAIVRAVCCPADLLFLDIQIPDMLGMEAAKRIRKMDNRVMIIFITMLTQYAIEGYSVGAFDYVLKPVRYEEFSTKMDRVCRMLAHQNTSMTLEVRTKEEIRRVNADEITYIEVSNHDVLIHTDSEIIRQWGNLKSYEEKLAPVHFVRCSASFLVNLKYVRAVNGNSLMVHGQEFLMALAQYKGGSR